MGKIEATNEMAERYLDIALQYGDLYHFLECSPIYGLYVKDINGNMVASAKHAMDAIYNKYKTKPEIATLTYNVIKEELNKLRSEDPFLNLLSVIEYQIVCEKNQTAPFNLNCLELLKLAKENIERNEVKYKASTDYYGEKGIWNQIEQHRNYVNDVLMESKVL